MRSPRRPVSSVAASVDALRRQFGLGRLATYETLIESWPELVGPQAAAESQVIELRDGILRVEAYDSAVAELIGWSRKDLIGAIRDRCPNEFITDVAVRVRRRPNA